MKRKFLVGVTTLILTTTLATWAADEGAALYKKKCSGCHGADGAGKSSMKAPALKETSMESSQIVTHITKGESTSKPPHNKGISGLTDEQAQAIADFVKTLK